MTTTVSAATWAAKRDAFVAALDGLSRNQSYTMPDGRSLTRADLQEVRETIDWLEKKVAEADRGSSLGIRRVTPVSS